MKRLTLITAVAISSIALTLSVRSQVAVAAPAQTPLEALQLLKARNVKIIEQQNATLQKLEELQKETHQLRILARRT